MNGIRVAQSCGLAAREINSLAPRTLSERPTSKRPRRPNHVRKLKLPRQAHGRAGKKRKKRVNMNDVISSEILSQPAGEWSRISIFPDRSHPGRESGKKAHRHAFFLRPLVQRNLSNFFSVVVGRRNPRAKASLVQSTDHRHDRLARSSAQARQRGNNVKHPDRIIHLPSPENHDAEASDSAR
jgi:hypothetical protein